MTRGLHLLLRCVCVVSLLALPGISMASSTQATCYSSPDQAVEALTTESSLSSTIKNGGYRVTRVESDQILGKRWAIVVRCGHPEWPEVALQTSGARSMIAAPMKSSLGKSASPSPVVRAGEIVRLWKQESSLRIEVAGVSEESGALGQTIRVRLLRRNTEDQSIPEQFFGVIRGPSDVEMQP